MGSNTHNANINKANTSTFFVSSNLMPKFKVFGAGKKKVGKGLMFATEMQTCRRPLHTPAAGSVHNNVSNAGKRPDKKYTSTPSPEHVPTS